MATIKDKEEFPKNKAGKEYVKNKELLEEMIKSKEQDELTPRAIKMLTLICENIIRDRQDCLQGAILDCLMYWRSFNPEKSSNPFAYFSSVAANGIGKQWRKLGKLNFPNSIMTRIDGSQIHSLI